VAIRGDARAAGMAQPFRYEGIPLFISLLNRIKKRRQE
jgi:hypothetical protein